VSNDLKQRVHARLLGSPSLAELTGPGSERAVRTAVAELLRDEEPLLPAERLEVLVAELTDEIAGLGPLEPLLADDRVTEVMVNGPGRAYVERGGRLEPVPLALDAAGIVRLVERVVAPLGLRLDRASPMVDARLPDGSRVHAVIPPLAIDGPYVTIRRFGPRILPLAAFGLDERARSFLCWCVAAGWNLLVAGGTSAGKTTLLSSLSAAIPDDERIVTIEETAELRLAQSHVVRLEARPPNAEGAGGVSVRDLVRTALRMRPDRIVVGEVRGGEALDMLQALNTGHDGSLSTVHANGAIEAIARLETLVLLAGVGLPLAAVRSQLGAALDAVVFVARRRGGLRRVETIGEIGPGADGPDLRTLFTTTGGRLGPVADPSRPPRRPDAGAYGTRPRGAAR
jgi:pilus assembly protein CpaF